MSESNYNFQKLTPIDDVNLGAYKDALDFVFKNDDIKNVGITGAYGSGKSSVLESYKAKHHEKHFLHISLASFISTKDQITSQDQNGSINERVIEGKILNQLIHQIKEKDIPQTDFKIKRKISKSRTILISLGITFFCALIFYNIYYGWLHESFKNWLGSPLCRVISWAPLLVVFLFFTYYIVSLQINRCIIKKLNIHGTQVEILEKETESNFFDKNLNEVLYLFDKCGADVIVFEDMDRYNINQVFQRLREINTLVNNRKKAQREKASHKNFPFQKQFNSKNTKNDKNIPLRFFYLLRDDIFESKDRTKFFDFIIPIIPVLDSSNSYDQFFKYLETDIDQKFLRGISLYVDDMRILNNILNEYMIYYKQLFKEKQQKKYLKKNKLLAIIVYKNLFPKDFSDFQLNKGYLFNLFHKKETLIAENMRELQNTIIPLEKEVNRQSEPTEEQKNRLKEQKLEKEKLQNKKLCDILYELKIKNDDESRKRIDNYFYRKMRIHILI